MSDNFFPDSVNVESTSRYARLAQGKTKLRMLGAPIFFQETWGTDATGKRVPNRFPLGAVVAPEQIGPDGLRTCMAVKVYNYNEGAIQIWQVSQKTILKSIKEYSQNGAFGSPLNYDLEISKMGQAMTTKYSVIANPPTPVNAAVAELDATTPVDLMKLLSNADPFKPDSFAASI